MLLKLLVSSFVLIAAYSFYVFLCFTPVLLKREMPIGFESKIEIDDHLIDPKILSTILTYKTVTHSDEKVFENMFLYLEESLPSLREKMTRVNFENSLFYKWKGKDETLKPIVYLAHADVVPVPENDVQHWDSPPWGGEIVKNIDSTEYIYGRGAIDYKIGVAGMMTALDLLASDESFQPKRTIYLCIGFDEETISGIGARTIAEYFRNNGIRPRFILDEGGVLLKNLLKKLGVRNVVAVLPMAEKGGVNFNFSVTCKGGHSSRPPSDSACVHKLARIVQKAIDNPFPPKSERFLIPFLERLFPHTGIFYRFLFSVLLKLPRFFIENIFSKINNINAVMRTTIAPTVVRFGETSNVLPNNGFITLNVRVSPDNTMDEVIEHMQFLIADEEGATISNYEDVKSGKAGRFSREITNSDTLEYEMMVRTIKGVYEEKCGEIVDAPTVMLGGSDLFYYRDLSEITINFTPVLLDIEMEDIERIHGNNERLSVDGYKDAVRFYMLLLKNLQTLEGE